ncbi:MAG: TolC family protein, partial [Bacteroidota bacterium]
MTHSLYQSFTFKLLLFLLLKLCIGSIQAQSILDEYVAQGLENNQQYIQQQLNTQITTEQQNTAKSLFFPNIQFQASYTRANGGRLINVPAGDLINPTNTAINQLTGNDNLPTNIANVNEQFLPDDFHETKISIVQPILNTDIYYGYKARQAEVNVSIAKEQAYKAQLEYEIRKAYYNYAQLVEKKIILDSTRLVVKELVRVNSKFVKYDVATRDILYNSEAQLAQIDGQLATATKEINTSRSFFNYLLNRDFNESIT